MTTIGYGFQATMKALPGKADELEQLLLSGPVTGPSAHGGCVVFLVSRSASDPETLHLVEGWVSDEVHKAVFNSPEAQSYISQFGELVADSQYNDFIPRGGKAEIDSNATDGQTV